MNQRQLIIWSSCPVSIDGFEKSGLPAVIAGAGEKATRRFVEFFVAHHRNPNTRTAYHRAVRRFCAWVERQGLRLDAIQPVHVAAYIEEHSGSIPSVKQALAAIRALFDYLVVGQALPFNPASSVRGPKYSVKRGKTPVLAPEEARRLLDSIDITSVAGLRDRALIAAMTYTFARVGAVTKMTVADFFPNGKRWWLRLHEKGNKCHEVPAHHNLEQYLDEYLAAAGSEVVRQSPLFRSLDRHHNLSVRPMHRSDVLAMIKRRVRRAGLDRTVCCHTFRATGITAYLLNGGTIEKAQALANHASPKTTQLYNRSCDQITLDEIERVLI